MDTVPLLNVEADVILSFKVKTNYVPPCNVNVDTVPSLDVQVDMEKKVTITYMALKR